MAAGESKPQAMVVCGSRMVRLLMVLLAVGLSVYTIAPAVYWHVVADDGDVLSKWVLQYTPCPPDQDCNNNNNNNQASSSSSAAASTVLADSASNVLAIAQKLNSTLTECWFGTTDKAPPSEHQSVMVLHTDCHGSNRCMKEAIGQTLEQLQWEGLRLQKEAKSAQQRASSSGYLDASKKTVYRNQKRTSQKGTSAQARAEADLEKETTRANLWEKRARDLGWKPKPAGYQKYKKYIQMLDGGA